MISQVAAGIDIGDGLTCILNHRIGQYAASLDIRKAYRQIQVSQRDAMLRLSIWYDDPINKQQVLESILELLELHERFGDTSQTSVP